MAFWVVSICVLGIGLLAAHSLIPFGQYVILLIALPPILTFVENIGVFGSDNLLIPIVAILALRLAAP